MITLIFFALFFGSTLAQICPHGYDLVEGRCIRPLAFQVPFVLDDSLNDYRIECGKDGAHLPIINSDEENEIFNKIFLFYVVGPVNPLLVLDINCNIATRRLEWVDGTPIIYVPGHILPNYDCVAEQLTLVSELVDWTNVATNIPYYFTILCAMDIPGLPTPKPTEASTCPSQYQLMEGRCIRELSPGDWYTFDNDLPQLSAQCAQDNAHLPMIKSDEENEAFNRIFHTLEPYAFVFALDLVCNRTSSRLEWIDGAPLNYLPKGSNSAPTDCVAEHATLTSCPDADYWIQVGPSATTWCTVLCVTDPVSSPTSKPTETSTGRPTQTPDGDRCGGYTLMEAPTDYKHPCIKLYAYPATWESATRTCSADFASLVTINSEQENKYFARTAVSMFIVQGMHIGAHESPDNSNQWTWSDGEVPINGAIYNNFISSFPIPGAGSCVAMMTDNPSAFWINEDCQRDPLPFMCRRIDFSSMPKDCPTDTPLAGEDIFSPGLPFPDIPCQYVLFVAENKLVELEVITLVADTNKDYLEIHEKPVGNTLLANLTGTILSPIKIRTQESNVMRVNWKPNGSGNGRGFRIRYNQV